MTPDDFLRAYEGALDAQSWDAVAPLVHEDACVTFSTGAVHKGREAVGAAFRTNFAAIEGEAYRIANVHWVQRGERHATCLYDFVWSGTMGGQPAAGAGRGTSVLVRVEDGWQLLVEHLGPA